MENPSFTEDQIELAYNEAIEGINYVYRAIPASTPEEMASRNVLVALLVGMTHGAKIYGGLCEYAEDRRN